jgi:hypothetical protein
MASYLNVFDSYNMLNTDTTYSNTYNTTSNKSIYNNRKNNNIYCSYYEDDDEYYIERDEEDYDDDNSEFYNDNDEYYGFDDNISKHKEEKFERDLLTNKHLLLASNEILKSLTFETPAVAAFESAAFAALKPDYNKIIRVCNLLLMQTDLLLIKNNDKLFINDIIDLCSKAAIAADLKALADSKAAIAADLKAFADNEHHKGAIKSIKDYINVLNERIANPLTE